MNSEPHATDPRSLAGGRIAWAAFVWSVLFGGLSLYWAAGGTIGASTLAATIQQRVREGDQPLLLLTGLSGVMKIAVGVFALATLQPRANWIPRRLLVMLLWGIGGLYALYGVANFVDKLLMLTELRSTPAAVGVDAVIWYVLVWEPVWMLGGVLFLSTARSFHRSLQSGRR